MKLLRKRTRPRGLRLFFASDIHGSEDCFRKWLNARVAYDVDILVLGGDVAGKTLVPVVEVGNGSWRANFLGRNETATSVEELNELRRRIRRVGCYDLLLSASEKRAMDDDPTLVATAFEDEIRRSIERWLALAEARLGAETTCYVMLGNDDPPALRSAFADSVVVVDAEDKALKLPNDFELVSSGFSTPTPWATPRELPEDELLARYIGLMELAENPRRSICNFHVPPRDTELDQAPLLDDDLRPVSGPAGGGILTSVGSTAVREVIERYQPVLGLHGHVHECSGATRLGRTLCINPGSEYANGVLRGAIVELYDEEDVRWQLTQG